MENMIRQMGKKVFLISLIIVIFITIVIEVYPSNGSLMSEGILKTGQIIALLMCVIPAIIGFVFYNFFFTKEKQISVRKLLKFNGPGIDKALATNIIENTNIIKSE